MTDTSPPTPPAIASPLIYGGQATTLTTAAITASLTISCGKGRVKIPMSTGKVELENCDLDDGAAAFWRAVETMYPGALKKP